MCGIIGYNGSVKSAKEAIIAGLKNLEYRGYDSAGIALVENNGQHMVFQMKLMLIRIK